MIVSQETRARAQPKAGKILSRLSGLGFGSRQTVDQIGIRESDDGEARRISCCDDEGPATLLVDGVKCVIDNLHAHLEQLIRIAADSQQFLRKVSAHLDIQSLPLRL